MDIKIEHKFYTYPDYMEDEDYLKVLLVNDIVFINNGWYNAGWPKDAISVHLNCNDVFMWGCADAEDILHSDLKEIYELYTKDPIHGPTMWAIKKRKCKPQQPVEDIIKKSGLWNLEELYKQWEIK